MDVCYFALCVCVVGYVSTELVKRIGCVFPSSSTTVSTICLMSWHSTILAFYWYGVQYRVLFQHIFPLHRNAPYLLQSSHPHSHTYQLELQICAACILTMYSASLQQRIIENFLVNYSLHLLFRTVYYFQTEYNRKIEKANYISIGVGHA